jgi:alkylation response protein AidB-like acyl-CoA dehydrogenase
MSSFLKDNDDLQYYVEQGIDWDTLADLCEGGFKQPGGFENARDARQFYAEALNMVGEFTAEEVAPHHLEIDREGVRFENGEAVFPERLQTIFDKIKGLELHGLTLPRELGGQNAPMLLYFVASEMLARADVSVMTHNSFHAGLAQTLLTYSIREGSTRFDPETGRIAETRFQEQIAEIVRGEAWASMDITEPGAGSDMARLRAYAEQDADGKWYVTGQKIFITSGHAKYHVVIARTARASENDDAAGLRGLSLFLVPAYEEDEAGNRRRFVGIDRLEEKMGHHGSVTAALNFDRAPAELIGKPGQGFEYMLMLMNDARLTVGFECIGLCEAAHRLAKAYAAERRSMGKTIDRHEMIADYLDEMDVDIRGLRALAMHGAVHEELATRRAILRDHGPGLSAADKRRLSEQIRDSKAKARRATPLLKYLAGEKAVELSRRSIQIHGGAGYIREYGAEKLLRDAMVLPIYEGTSQIQSLMAMRDTLGAIMKNPQAFMKRYAQTRWRSLSARDASERRVARLQLLSLNAQQYLLARTAGDKFRAVQGKPVTEWPNALLKNWDPKRDFAYAMLHAERLTRLLADEHIAEILLEQAKRHPHRMAVLERYLDRAEPRCRYLHDEITTTGQRLLARVAADEPAESKAAS